MKKVIVKFSILTVCGVALFFLAHEYANYTRGYDAIGGEAFFILFPVFWQIVKSMARDIKAQYLENRKK